MISLCYLLLVDYQYSDKEVTFLWLILLSYCRLIGEIGTENEDLLPDMVPTLIFFLKDETPAVARQAITTGTNLFRNVLEKIVTQVQLCK